VLDGLNPPTLGDFYAAYLMRVSEWDPVARTSFIEAKTYMAHTLLRDADAMSMAHALEVRVPLLDHKFAEFALAIPPQLKLDLRGRQTKVLLVRSLHDLLPEETVNRRKMGFEFPLDDWLAGPLQERVMEVLTSVGARQLFTSAALERLRRQARSGRGGCSRVWVPMVLAAWMQHHRCRL
jgi:asparagine synthase (glutamine-hydrolysing)